jgi:serine/threonine protein kinase
MSDNILPEVAPSPPLTPDDEDNEDNELLEANLITSQPLYDLTTIIDHPFQQDLNFDAGFSQVHELDHRYSGKVFRAHMNMNNEYDTVEIKMIDRYEPVIEIIHELAMLSKLQHTSIIQLIGTGNIPRRFVVFPHLSGGTLQDKLEENRKPYALIPRYFHYKPTFTYLRVLQLAKSIAQALHYMHVLAHPGACFIHRSK